MKTLSGFVAALAREAWAMEEGRLTALFERLSHPFDVATWGPPRLAEYENPHGPLAGLFDAAPPISRMTTAADGVATIPITGVLMKSVPKIFRYFGIDATSYQEIQGDLAKANADPSVKSIQLAIDSPGGQVSGVKETADAIASSPKPVSANVNDLGASAAYWLASQATHVSATQNALVGSLGVYSSYVDSSKAAADAGFKVHLVASGPHKGMGTPGVPITAEQLAGAREVIDGMAANFMADVAKGRGKSAETVATWATGQVWLAKSAKAMGLIDSIATSETTKGAAGVRPAAEISNPEKTEETMDPKELEAQKAKAASDAVAADRARCAAITAAFPEDPSFALTQIEKGASLIEAKAAYSDVQREQRKAAELEAKKPKPAPGAKASTGGGSASDDVAGEQDFMVLVEQHIKATGCNKLQAMSAMCKKHPKLYAEFDLRLVK